jgi:rod shape-determining protein MreB and related proteins
MGGSDAAQVIGSPKLFGLRAGRIVICVPSGCTEVERRAVGDAAYNADAQMVNILDEPMAAAIGAGMPVTKPTGSMIVDIGGGTTEIAVLSLNGIVVSKSLRVAGDELNENIQAHLKQKHALGVGERTAEAIKIRLGSAFASANSEEEAMDVRGISLSTGLPHTATIYTSEIRDALMPTLKQMVAGIIAILEETPPELAADIVDRGIMLAGGGALLPGLDELIQQEVDVPVHVANDPLSCVVLGTEKILMDPVYKSILDNSEYIPRM